MKTKKLSLNKRAENKDAQDLIFCPRVLWSPVRVRSHPPHEPQHTPDFAICYIQYTSPYQIELLKFRRKKQCASLDRQPCSHFTPFLFEKKLLPPIIKASFRPQEMILIAPRFFISFIQGKCEVSRNADQARYQNSSAGVDFMELTLKSDFRKHSFASNVSKIFPIFRRIYMEDLYVGRRGVIPKFLLKTSYGADESETRSQYQGNVGEAVRSRTRHRQRVKSHSFSKPLGPGQMTLQLPPFSSTLLQIWSQRTIFVEMRITNAEPEWSTCLPCKELK